MYSMVWLLCACVLHVTFVLGQPPPDPPMPNRSPDQRYPFFTDMDSEGKYVLRWGFNDTHILFEVQVQTLGYVAFGVSRNDRMFPADVVVGWIANNQVNFKDYHTVGHSHPVEDTPETNQNWHVEYGYEDSGWTVLGFHRALDTCDPVGDIKIDRNTVKLIYSYAERDPDASMDFPLFYHSRKGAKSVSLLTFSPPPMSFPADSSVVDFTNENHTISSENMTSYHCQVFDLSGVDRKYHIIKAAPVYSTLTQYLVDHMILYRCRHPDPARMLAMGSSFNCFTDAPDYMQFCREHVASFGHGKEDLFLPEDVGIPIGGPGEANVYILATHYENEMFQTGMVDNSGIRLTYTEELRANEAGFLSMGSIISPNWLQYIPPGEASFVQRAHCTERCLGWGFRGSNSGVNVPMTIVGVQFHAHGLAKAMKLRHVSRTGRRQYVDNPWLEHDDQFDANYQTFRLAAGLAAERKRVAYYDRMILECTYDTTDRTMPTVGGWGERNELCRAYVLYYPRKAIEGCMSWSNYDQLQNPAGNLVPGNQAFQLLINTDWTNNVQMRSNLRRALDESIENGQCWSSKRTPSYGIDWFWQTRQRPSAMYRPPIINTCPVRPSPVV